MKRYVKVIALTGIVFAAVTALAVVNGFRAVRYSRELSENYVRALSGLTESVSAVDIGLHKCICAGTQEGFAENAAQVWAESQRGKVYLSELPSSGGELDGIERFLAQAGDRAISTASQSSIPAEDYDSLIALSEYAASLRIVLEDIIASINDPDSISDSWHRLSEFSRGELLRGGLESAGDMLQSYPAMIYDGPFSDHVFERTPALIEGLDEVSESEARIAAAEFAGNEMHISGRSDNTIGEYIFHSSDGNTETAVTRRGGIVSYMIRDVNIGQQRVTTEQAEAAAGEFMRRIGMSGFVPLQYCTYGGSCVFSFAPQQDNIVLYPDQVKVAVALDCGDAVAYDARDYIMNHHDRNTLRADFTLLQAQEQISGMLTVTDSRLVLIQTDGLSEKLCYEFICRRWDGGDAAVYINANTLKEEKIYLLSRTADSFLAV